MADVLALTSVVMAKPRDELAPTPTTEQGAR